MYDDHRGGNGTAVLLAFLLGGLIGAVLGLLFAPQSGEESRRMIKAYEEAQAQGKGAASLDGKMIDIAMYRMGLETIAKAEGIEKRARQRKEEA